MRNSGSSAVVGKDGLAGVLLDPLPPRITSDHTVRVKLEDGRVIQIPAEIVVEGSDGTYLIPVGLEDIEPGPVDGEARKSSGARSDSGHKEDVIPVLAEQLVVDKKAVQTGGVRVTRHVMEHEESIELPLHKEDLDVRRVVMDQEVDGPLPVRRQGDTTIIPIVEEVLIVQKRYRLKEEIHVTRTVREELHQERVTVRRQEAEIEGFDADGRTRSVQATEVVTAAPPRRRPRRTILGKG